MKTYELTYIISSGTTTTDADAIKQEVESFIQSKEGVILSSEKTSAQTLSYRIKKQSSGFYVIVKFQANENVIKEVKDKLLKDTRILRHLVVIKKPAKEMKERRTRKPLSVLNPDAASPFVKSEDKKTEKVEMEDIEKKLDEILSE